MLRASNKEERHNTSCMWLLSGHALPAPSPNLPPTLGDVGLKLLAHLERGRLMPDAGLDPASIRCGLARVSPSKPLGT